MSKEFLLTISKQKAREVGELETGSLQPLRETHKLYNYLKNNAKKLQVIAEVKKASPSPGDVNFNVDTVKQVKTYQDNGAAMISVPADPSSFGGNIDYLRQISSQVGTPTLARDFIIDEKQITRSRNAGTTIILLIVAALPEARSKELYDFATGLGLEVLPEAYNLSESEVAHRIGAKTAGVNNRSLVTSETNINTSLELLAHFKEMPVCISESTIFTKDDAALIAPFLNDILAGTTLMKADNASEEVKELQIDKG